MYKYIETYEVNKLSKMFSKIYYFYKVCTNGTVKRFEEESLGLDDAWVLYDELIENEVYKIRSISSCMLNILFKNNLIDHSMKEDLEFMSSDIGQHIEYAREPVFAREFGEIMQSIVTKNFESLNPIFKICMFSDLVPIEENKGYCVDHVFNTFETTVKECTKDLTDESYNGDSALDITLETFEEDILIIAIKNMNFDTNRLDKINEFIIDYNDQNTEGIFFKDGNLYLVLSDTAVINISLETIIYLIFLFKEINDNYVYITQ